MSYSVNNANGLVIKIIILTSLWNRCLLVVRYPITFMNAYSRRKNKRPMSHIAHLRKQFKSINTYDCIKTLIKRRKKTLTNSLVLHLKKTPLHPKKSPSPKDALCQDWLKLAQWFWRRGFFNFVNVFSLFRYYLPLEKKLCQVWMKLTQWFWRRRWMCEKFTDIRTDRHTDRRRTTGDQKSSLELSAHVS